MIPVFPGTNCEYDTAKAFEKAGAIASVVVMRNLSPLMIEESAKLLASEIANAQMIMLPGGFSGGDEPDGSGKFIATTFRSGRIKDATHDLLKNRDGLMLGICNGFQALVKLGLVPYGEIREMREDSPTLTYNNIGRHVSCIVRTRVTSANSPWLMLSEPGELYSVAVSHGEGRFVASEKELGELFRNGQVATQYVDMDGNPDDGYALQPQRVDGGGGGHYEPGRQGARENGPLGTRRAAYRQKRSRRLRPENFRERRKIFPVKRAGEKAFAKRRTPFLAAF